MSLIPNFITIVAHHCSTKAGQTHLSMSVGDENAVMYTMTLKNRCENRYDSTAQTLVESKLLLFLRVPPRGLDVSLDSGKLLLTRSIRGRLSLTSSSKLAELCSLLRSRLSFFPLRGDLPLNSLGAEGAEGLEIFRLAVFKEIFSSFVAKL